MQSKVLILLLRLSLGWLFFYSGITKILNPDWTAAGYLNAAKTFAGVYHWFASPGVIPLINFVNEWGQLILGIALILGIFVRLGSIFGAVLMLLYYLPILEFPYIGKNSFIVDEHVIYALALLLLGVLHAGRVWGLENWCSRLPICAKYPRLRYWIG